MTIEIREATSADVDAICAIGERTWPPTYAFAGPHYVADGIARWWSPDVVQRGIDDSTTLVAADDGRVIGMSLLDLGMSPPVIWKLYVLPERHGDGVGHALMEATCERAAPTADAVRLEYTDGNARAQRFYERHGFVEVEREPSPHDGWPGGVWMERRLH